MKITIPKKLSLIEKIRVSLDIENNWNEKLERCFKESSTYYAETNNYLSLILRIECDCGEKFVTTSPSYGHDVNCPCCNKIIEINQDVYEKFDLPELY